MQFRRRRRFSISANTGERNYTRTSARLRVPDSRSHFETGADPIVDFLACCLPHAWGLPMVPLYESQAVSTPRVSSFETHRRHVDESSRCVGWRAIGTANRDIAL